MEPNEVGMVNNFIRRGPLKAKLSVFCHIEVSDLVVCFFLVQNCCSCLQHPPFLWLHPHSS